MKKLFTILYVFICLTIVLAKEVYGYLDPSAMTYLIQVLATIGVTLTTTIGILFYKIRKKIKNKKENEDKIVEDDNITVTKQ